MNAVEKGMENTGVLDIANLLKAHLLNIDTPLQGQAAKKTKDLVHFPLREPSAKGGLTPKGRTWVVSSKLESSRKTELLELSKNHAEQARIQIQAVILTCWLFSESKQRELNPKELHALKAGIYLSEKLGLMQTVKKNGRLLTDDFEEMMSKLYRILKKGGSTPMEKNPHWPILKKAAALQTKTKEKEIKAAAPSLALS